MHGVRYWYIYAEYNMADLKAHMPQLHYDILFFLPTPFSVRLNTACLSHHLQRPLLKV